MRVYLIVPCSTATDCAIVPSTWTAAAPSAQGEHDVVLSIRQSFCSLSLLLRPCSLIAFTLPRIPLLPLTSLHTLPSSGTRTSLAPTSSLALSRLFQRFFGCCCLRPSMWLSLPSVVPFFSSWWLLVLQAYWPISCAISYAMALSLAASTLTFCLPLLWPCSLMAPTRQWFPCLSWWLLVLPAYRTVSCAIAYALALSLATTLALTLECLQLWF
jgi:hypothetical protein